MRPALRLSLVVAIALAPAACSLLFNPDDDGRAPTADAAPATDAGDEPDDAGEEGDAARDAGDDVDAGPVDDGDLLPFDNDPCPEQPNALLFEDFSGWGELADGAPWTFDGVEAVYAYDTAFLRSPACPDGCPDRYVFDVRVQLSAGDYPTLTGIHGHITYPDGVIHDTHCGVEGIPDNPTLVLAQAPWDEPPGPPGSRLPLGTTPATFILRLIVSLPDAWCLLDDNPPVTLLGMDEDAGNLGIWTGGGYARFDQVRIWDIPPDCSAIKAVPAPPPPTD